MTRTITTAKLNDTQKKARQLAFLQQVNQFVASDKPVETILQAVLHQLLASLGYKAAQIYQLSEVGKDIWLYLEAGRGTKPVTQIKDIFSIDENNIITDTLRRGKPTCVQDINQGPYSYFGEEEDQQGAELALPLVYGSNLLGVLRIQSASTNAFDDKDLDYFSSLAALMAASMQNYRKIGQLKDSIQEIKTLYSLHYREHINQQHFRAEHHAPISYEYQQGTVLKSDSPPAIPNSSYRTPADLTGIITSRRNGHKDILAPIRLHNETIGLLGLEDTTTDTSEWTVEDISLLEEVTTQVALAIENARLLQQTQEQTAELSILFEATRQLTETIDLQQIYKILTTHTINYFNADRGSVLLLNQERTHFESIIVQTHNSLNNVLEAGQAYVKAVDDHSSLQTMIKQPQLIIQHLDNPDLGAKTRQQSPDDSTAAGWTLTQFPLIIRNRLVGVVEIEHTSQPHQYTENELRLAQAVITQVTVAIENAQLFQQTQEALADTQKLYDISRQLVESTSVDDIFNIILETVKAYEIDRVSISLIDWNPFGEIDSVRIAATWDRDPDKNLPVGAKFSAKDFSLVQTFARPPFVPLISENLRFAADQDARMDEAFRQYVVNTLDAVTLFSAPMFLGSEYRGVLSIYTRKPHKYTPREIRIYQTLADQAIIAIENYRLLETTRAERDRASLLYKLGQTLSHITTVEQVKEVLINYIYEIGATDGEFYITDGAEFVSIASTIPERQKLPPQKLAAIVLANGPEALALTRQEIVVMSRDETPENEWPLREQPDMVSIQSFVSVPFFSQRSTLQGTLTFFHDEAGAFSQDHISTFESIAIQTAATLENVWLLRQTNVVLQETELLYNVTRGFNSAKSIEDLLAVISSNFFAPGIDFMTIGLISKMSGTTEPQQVELVARWNKDTGEVASFNMALTAGDYACIRHFSPSRPSEFYYHQLDAKTQANIDQHLNRVRAILAIPLIAGSNWLGMLLLASQNEAHNFNVNTISQISALSGQAAMVIQNLQLVDETQRNLRYSEILSTLGQALLTAETPETIYALALSAVAKTEPDRGAAVFIYDRLENQVQLNFAAGWDHPHREGPAMSAAAPYLTKDLELISLLETDLTVVSHQVGDDQRMSKKLQQRFAALQIRSLVATPLWINKEVGGFLLVANNTERRFSSDLIRLYENIARETARALENRRLFDEAQHRAWQLQTAADISQAATAYLDLDTLLFESVDLIKERFKFYHASIFLIDEYQRYAVVRASTGEIGRKMLDMNHKLAVGGRSIVGTATATGKPRVALDVGQDAVHFDNPLLPDTRSEMALPLIAQGKVIGALDVQSTRQNAFSPSDITILQSMANQLANAIEAARAYREAREALEEVSKLHQRYLLEQWASFLREQSKTSGFELVDSEQLVEISQDSKAVFGTETAFEQKKPMIIPAPRLAQAGAGEKQTIADVSTLVAPLALHSQSVIGAVELELANRDLDDIWTEEILKIVEAVSGQAAQAIETARLFEQSQIAREEAEALYQVGRALVAAETEQDMFNTILNKMLQTLGLKQGGVLLINEDGQFGKLYALYKNGKPVTGLLAEFPIAGNLSYEKLMKTKQPVAIEDMATDPLVAKVREVGLAPEVTSLLLVPIVINDQVIGAIGADSVGKKYHFTERDKNLAMAMADQLSIALQNRRLIEETRRKAILLQASADVGRVATSILDQENLINRTVDLIQERFGFPFVQIYLIDDTGQYSILHQSAGSGAQEGWMSPSTLAVGGPDVIGQTTARRQPVVIRAGDDQDSGMAESSSARTRTQLGIPLQVGDALIGAIGIQGGRTNDFTDEDISTLETLAAQLAVAIQNARAFKEQQETAQRLKEIDKLKTQFLANMSHELRTPLNSIIGFSRVILKGIDGPLTELQKADLTSIHHSGQHLLGLINNILDLSKIEAGKMELNFEETEVEPIIKTVMSTAIALVKDKPVTLEQEIPENLPKIWGDPTRIRQIILNLVSNACKFTDEGVVTTRVMADDHRVIFSVSDTGIGIPEEKLEHIFEEFTQVDASTTRRAGGSGLGLPISRHFVEMHHGDIWVESQLGRGTTFSFYVPTLPPEQMQALSRAHKSGNTTPAEPRRVLVAIDSDPAVQKLYKRYLEKHHYEVIALNNGQDAAARVRKFSPFAVLLDIMLPEKDGWNVIKELKEDTFTRNIPVIICSRVDDKNRGRALGATDYLVKPITEHDLLHALNQLDSEQKEQLKVLVVDDQADDILLIRRILEAQANYLIIEARNGQEGLELVKTKQPDLIILDLSMPKMDGFKMIELLKENQKTRNIPIIVVSAQEPSPTELNRLTGQVEVILRKGIFTEKELLADVGLALEKIQQVEKQGER